MYGPVVPYGGEPRPLGAFVLSLIGGLFILLAGITELSIDYAVSVSVPPVSGQPWVAILGAVGVALGMVVIAASVGLYLYPAHHALFGVVVLVASLLSFLSFWGFLVGLVLGLVGGVLGIAWSPYRSPFVAYGFPSYAIGGTGAPPPAAPPPGAHRACLKCGRLGAGDAKFCAYCGAPMPGP